MRLGTHRTLGLAVIDASVASKWVLADPESVTATRLLDGRFKLMAPSLVRKGVAEAVIDAVRRGDIDTDMAGLARARLDRLIADGFLNLVPVEKLYDTAIQVACGHGLLVDECLYLAAAKFLNCRLITADRQTFDRLRTAREQVELLSSDT